MADFGDNNSDSSLDEEFPWHYDNYCLHHREKFGPDDCLLEEHLLLEGTTWTQVTVYPPSEY